MDISYVQTATYIHTYIRAHRQTPKRKLEENKQIDADTQKLDTIEEDRVR